MSLTVVMKTIVLGVISSLMVNSLNISSLEVSLPNDVDVVSFDEDEFYAQEVKDAAEVGLIIGKGVKLKEVYSESGEIVAHREDFDTEEKFEEYLKEKGLTYVESSFDKELEEMQRDINGVQAVNTTNVSVEPLYYANFDYCANATIQAFVVDGSYIYTTQRYTTWKFNGDTTFTEGNYILLSRCIISTDNNGNQIFSRVDAMLLQDVGHGQTLEKYVYDGTPYLWISCGNNQLSGADKCWSVQMGRIQYNGLSLNQLKNPSNVINNSQIKRLTDLSYSRTSNLPFDPVWRSDSAISIDSTYGNYLFIWKQASGNYPASEFSIYDFDTVNDVLSNSSGNAVSFQGNTDLRNACQTSYTQTNLPTRTDGTTGSFQGFDISKKSNGIHSIYLASGDESKAYYENANKIFRYNTLGNKKCEAIINDTGIWIYYGESNSYNAIAEIEGVKIAGNYLNFVLRDTNGNHSDRQVIVKALKSNFQ